MSSINEAAYKLCEISVKGYANDKFTFFKTLMCVLFCMIEFNCESAFLPLRLHDL